MNYRLEDIIDIPQFQILQDKLNEIYSFPSAIIDNDGRVLTATAWQDICTKFHRENPECLAHCIESDKYILDHLDEANPAVTYRCPHGLVDNAAPIIIDGVHYGNFFTGQFFLEQPDLDFFRAQAARYGFDEETYLEAVRKVPVWSREQLNSYLFFIKGLIAIISENGLKNLKEKEYRQHIESTEKRAATILRTAVDGYWLVNQEGLLLEVNESYSRMSGYSLDELAGMRVADLEALERQEQVEERIREIQEKGSVRFVSRHRRKDGILFDVEVRINHLPGEEGCFVVFIQDITERKRDQDRLRESRERLELAARSARLGIWDLDIVNDRLLWDDRMYEIYGVSPDSPLSGIELWKGAVHPEDFSSAWEAFQAALRDEKKYEIEFRVCRPDGGVRWVKADGLVQFDSRGKPLRMTGINRDITEEKLAREALKQAQVFLDNISDIAYVADRRGCVVWGNRASERISGISPPELAGKPFKALFVDEDHPSLMDVYQRTLQGESLENTLTFKSGITCHFTSLPRYNASGEIIGTFGVARDITERLKAEKALQTSESRLLRAQEAAKIGNWEFDVSTGLVWGSEEAFRIYGLERKSEYLPLDEVESRIPEAARVNQALVDLITLDKPYDIEFEIRPGNREGVTIIHSLAELVRDPRGNPLKVTGVIQDVTEARLREAERISLKEQLLQTQKMESLGQLAGGIAHDFNNQLSGILGYAELLASTLEDPAQRKFAENICTAAANGSRLTRQLLSFARKGQYSREPVNLYDICDEVEGILKHTIDRQITLRQERLMPRPTILGDRHQLQNAVLNIALNARDAIAGRGEIVFSLSREDVAAGSPLSDLKPGTYVSFKITDTGCGMDPSVREHIFDPFFTTKKVGEGTGMGLPSAYGAVKTHGGDILVESVPGEGSTFQILLPHTPDSPDKEKPAPVKHPDTGRSAGILLVDDEDLIRDLYSRFLEDQGYQVFTASDGREGLEIFSASHDRIDLVVLDMIMPEMGGRDLFDEIRKIKPRIPVVISSGFSPREDSIQTILRDGAHFLQKPVSLKDLSEAIDGILTENLSF